MGAFPQLGWPRGGRPWKGPHARSEPSRDRDPWPPCLPRRSARSLPRNLRAPRSTPPRPDGKRPDGTRVQGLLAKQSTPALASHTRCRGRRPLRCELCHPDACPSVTQRDRSRQTTATADKTRGPRTRQALAHQALARRRSKALARGEGAWTPGQAPPPLLSAERPCRARQHTFGKRFPGPAEGQLTLPLTQGPFPPRARVCPRPAGFVGPAPEGASTHPAARSPRAQAPAGSASPAPPRPTLGSHGPRPARQGS